MKYKYDENIGGGGGSQNAGVLVVLVYFGIITFWNNAT